VPGKLLQGLIPGYETREMDEFTVLLSTQAIKEGMEAGGAPFKTLQTEFDGLLKALPAKAVKILRRIPVWIEWDSRTGDNMHALAVYRSADHYVSGPYGGTLKNGAIQLFSLKKLTHEKESSIRRSRLVLLHEMSHAIHHVMLGYGNQQVRFAYHQAMDRKLYDRVQTDWGSVERAYAATNAAEYFAELSCAYLDRCQSYPFTRDELKEHDPTGYQLMESIWGNAARLSNQQGRRENAGKTNGNEPEDGMKRMIEKCIRNDISSKSLRIEHWHPPRRARDSQKEGLLYRVEFSVQVVNLREGQMQRRNSNYYLFIVDDSIIGKQINPSGWEAVNICKIE
jgi:hypothetical protein